MTYAPALLGCFPCWRADAGLPSNRLRPAQRQGVAERALLRSVLEQRGRHKIILPSPADLSPMIPMASPNRLHAIAFLSWRDGLPGVT
jgi:hypothetical protein